MCSSSMARARDPRDRNYGDTITVLAEDEEEMVPGDYNVVAWPVAMIMMAM